MTESAPRWGGVDLVVVFVVAQLASALGFVLFALAQGIPADDLDTAALTIGEVALLQVPLWLGLLGVPLVATRLRGNGPRPALGLWQTLPDMPTHLSIAVPAHLVPVPPAAPPTSMGIARGRERGGETGVCRAVRRR